MRTVTILLTKYSDWTSTLFYYIGGRGYTHASLSLEDESTYYSFNFKGFCTETLEKHQRKGVKKSLSYQLEVSDASYQKMQSMIMDFVEHQDEFSYTRLGAFFCLLGISFHWKQHYFCSQFVAEILSATGAIPLRKAPALYLPNDFQHELKDSMQLSRIEFNPI